MPAINKILSVLALLPLAAQTLAAPAEFWYSHSGAAAAAIADLCKSFNAQREEGDRLHCIRQGTYEQTLQKTVAAYRAGIGPALVEIYDVATPDMLQGGATQPVETLMADHQRAYAGDTFLPALRRYYAALKKKRTCLPCRHSIRAVDLAGTNQRSAGYRGRDPR